MISVGSTFYTQKLAASHPCKCIKNIILRSFFLRQLGHCADVLRYDRIKLVSRCMQFNLAYILFVDSGSCTPHSDGIPTSVLYHPRRFFLDTPCTVEGGGRLRQSVMAVRGVHADWRLSPVYTELYGEDEQYHRTTNDRPWAKSTVIASSKNHRHCLDNASVCPSSS